jgi:hypothetical protein
MTFDSIQPVAFRIRADALPLMRDCITLPFPEQWATSFKKLQAIVLNRPIEKTTVPIASLNRTLRAVVPPIVSIGRGATSRWALSEGKPWLYAQKNIEPAVLVSVVHAWARALFGAVPDEQLNQVLKTIQTHDVKWNVEQLDLVDWKKNDAGTAAPSNPGQFIVFPDYVAATLSSITEGFQYGDHQLHFRRSSLAPGQRGAELTSWPPLLDGDALYSVILTFTMQTVPFQAYPVLHCDVSLRRWAGPKRVFLKQRANAYIATNLPFVPELDGWSNQLQVISLKREINLVGNWTSHWEDHLVDILAQLRSKASLIDANQLTDTPTIGQRDWDNAAAIVYSTRMKRHRIGAGVAIRERGQLFDQLTDLLSNLFEPVVPLPRVKVSKREKVGFRSNPFFMKIQNDKKQDLITEQRIVIGEANKQIWAERRAFICETVGDHLRLEICASSTDVRDNLIAAAQDILGIALNGDPMQEIATSELAITVTFSNLGILTDNLDVGSGKGVRERVRDATQRRINDVVRALPKIQTPTLVLAEILSKEKYTKNSDPKSPLRIGIGRSQRLVQFITADNVDAVPSSDEEDEEESVAPLYYRAMNALLDGLRQLGVPGKLPAQARAGRPITIIGAWLINKKSSKAGNESYTLPVLVRTSSADNDILAIAPGFEKWLPYREALLELSKTDVLGSQNKRADYTAFLRAELLRTVSKENDTLLICHAQNMRETWTWISNTNLVCDAIAFHPSEITVPIAEWPGLRIVRVRDGQSHETPEWFAEKDGWRSAAAGLFKMGERVFASTHSKPKQMTSYSHYFSKAEMWSSRTSPDRFVPPKPNRPTWNPGLYELTVAALQPEDNGDPTIWAHLTHELRQSCLHFEDATALPLQLHLAKLMGEYILSVDIQDDEEA